MKAGVVIVNLGTGNLRSVRNAFEYVGGKGDVEVSANPSTIREAERLVLPGQGAIGTWMGQLSRDSRLHAAVVDRLQTGPVLGICLGLQALFEYSEENNGVDGLGLLYGQVRHFASDNRNRQESLKIPHMGWNNVRQTADHPLWHGIENNERFYFVHSYYADAAEPESIMGECSYGRTFTAAAAKDNVFATQFHPEKSQQAGLQLIKNFINWNGVH